MEQIPIREAARRLGVSDTAVRKAIAAGRVTTVGQTPQGWPLVGWPQTKQQWRANTDTMKRSHVGGRGGRGRELDAPAEPLPVNTQPDKPVPPPAPAPAPMPEPPKAEQPIEAPPEPITRGPSYAQSRAVREAYQARLAKLEFEQKSGKLVSADEVKAAWFKQIKAAQTRILGLATACKTRCPELPLAAVATIEAVCREALEDLANGGD